MSKVFLNSNNAFKITVVILTAAVILMQLAIDLTGFILVKEPVALKKPLDQLEGAVSPYTVNVKSKISGEIVESLGTDDYIKWEIENPGADNSDPTKYCSLFITYYPKADRVPHVPEECYIGGGNRQLSREDVKLSLIDYDFSVTRKDEDTTLKIDKQDDSPNMKEIKAKYLVFIRKDAEIWQSSAKYPVMYIFNVNGKYANSRTEVREILGMNLFGKYSYFSKVEWTFYGKRGNLSFFPTKEESIEASNKLMSVILPTLEAEYWPEWE